MKAGFVLSPQFSAHIELTCEQRIKIAHIKRHLWKNTTHAFIQFPGAYLPKMPSLLQIFISPQNFAAN